MNRKSEQRNLGRRLGGVTMPIRRKRIKWQRNWPCLCGSEKKYKRCCMVEVDSLTASDNNADIMSLPEDVQKMIDDRARTKKTRGREKNE